MGSLTDWINALVAVSSLVVSVVALVLSARAQREANAVQKRIVKIEERRDLDKRVEKIATAMLGKPREKE